jgi:hypothetical protein
MIAIDSNSFLPFLTSSVTNEKRGRERNTKCEYRVCVTKLPGETSQWSVVEEYVIMVLWWLAGENRRNLKNNMLHCQFGLHESCMNPLETEPDALKWDASTLTPELWHGQLFLVQWFPAVAMPYFWGITGKSRKYGGPWKLLSWPRKFHF